MNEDLLTGHVWSNRKSTRNQPTLVMRETVENVFISRIVIWIDRFDHLLVDQFTKEFAIRSSRNYSGSLSL